MLSANFLPVENHVQTSKTLELKIPTKKNKTMAPLLSAVYISRQEQSGYYAI